MRRQFSIASARGNRQIESLDTALRSEITRIDTQIIQINSELNLHPQIHEAYVLASVGEDDRLRGHSAVAFEHFLSSAFIFTQDLEHYTLRFMSSLSSMRNALDDLWRPLMGDRRPELTQFLARRERLISDLERLREQTNGLVHSSEQAQQEIASLIQTLGGLHQPQNDFDEDGEPPSASDNK